MAASPTRVTAVLSLSVLLSVFSPNAHALTIGDAAITVGVSTAAGAALGASTLPFYGEPGKHTKNIFYGAALGAVAGVLLSAYAGVKGSDDDEDSAAAHRMRLEDLRAADALRYRPDSGNASIGAGPSRNVALAWYPLAQMRF